VLQCGVDVNRICCDYYSRGACWCALAVWPVLNIVVYVVLFCMLILFISDAGFVRVWLKLVWFGWYVWFVGRC
jgi:hypothetical protein